MESHFIRQQRIACDTIYAGFEFISQPDLSNQTFSLNQYAFYTIIILPDHFFFLENDKEREV